MPLFRLSNITLLTVSLLGCNPFQSEQEAMFDRYQNRLSNVLDTEYEAPPATPPIELPPAREMHQEIPRLTLGLLESYQLRECGLFQLLAEKNSSLGKVQDHFRDLSYQLDFLNTLSACLTSGKLSEEEVLKLSGIEKSKWDHLPIHLTNLILTSPAMRKQFTENHWMDAEVATHTFPVKHALEDFEQIGDLAFDKTTLRQFRVEDHQEILEKSRLIGRLYYSMERATEWLNSSTEMLEKNDNKVICGPNRDKTKLRYLNKVFQTYYAGEVQPYLADINRTYGELEQGLSFFESQISLRNQSYGIEQSHEDFRFAIVEHAKYWQGLFKRCGIRVGQ